jgi:Transcriptional regulator, AbiEi antitoxin
MSEGGRILLFMADPPALQELIRRQDRVVTRAQALQAGLSRHAIVYRLRDGGTWRSLLPGVYLTLPGAPTHAQWETAALLHAGPRAVITGAAALRYYEFRQIPRADRNVVDVLIPARSQRASTGCARVHRTAHMPHIWATGPAERRYVYPARAVVDTARWLTDLREVRALVGDAVQNRHCAVAQLAEELRSGGTPNGAVLRKVIAEVTAGVRSAPEAELRDLIVRARLPMPLFNPRLYSPNGTFIASPDAWWPDAGVAIEVDSRRWHLAPDDWERTMVRHSDLGQYGIVTLHVTPHQLRSAPDAFLRKAANAYKSGVGRPRLAVVTLPAPA